MNYEAVAKNIHSAGRALGFSAIGITRAKIDENAANGLRDWLAAGCHGEMDYMARHAELRLHPEQLHAGTVTVICAALDYLPPARTPPGPDAAAISRYAWGRDYHKVVRKRLQQLADTVGKQIGIFGYRVFSDSAPVMEVELARQAGLGWRGKHSLLLSRHGSWRFLGEIYTDLPLPPDVPTTGHCGQCTACLDACPTGAIVAPYRVDARRCISYLTIEHRGPVDEDLRGLMGNRIYGCDDCLAACPWNKFAQAARDIGYQPRVGAPALAELAALDDAGFRARFAGSPIKRIGRDRFVRNVLYAIGNSGLPALRPVAAALVGDPDPAVADAAQWAVSRLPLDDRLG